MPQWNAKLTKKTAWFDSIITQALSQLRMPRDFLLIRDAHRDVEEGNRI
jgi:hypothetical protein